MATIGPMMPRSPRSIALLPVFSVALAVFSVALLLVPTPAHAQLDRTEAAWAELVFTRTGFDEAVLLAQEWHVLPDVPARAWALAAAGLFKTLDPPLELLPKRFVQAERARADGAALYSGEVIELSGCGTRLHAELFARSKAPASAGSSAELRQMRLMRKEASLRLHAAWATATFGQAGFECAAQVATAMLNKQPLPDDAPPPLPDTATPTMADPRVARSSRMWRVATSNFLHGLDAHGSLMPTALFTALEKESSSSENVDVGMTLTTEGAVVRVTRVERTSPAAQAGLRKGWIIVRIDAKELTDLDPRQLNAMLEGKIGSKVIILAQVTSTSKPKKLVLKRRELVRSTVTGYAAGEGTGVGVVRLGSFASGSASGVRGSLEDVRLETGVLPTALVLDLRGNGGGWVKEGIAVADVFLGDGVVATQHNRRPPPKVFSATTAATDIKLPLVTLVDIECRSACEMVSSALQDRDRTVVLGQRTYGKGSVQAVLDATMGAWSVLLTIATYRGPRGRSLQSLGVEPDITLPLPSGWVVATAREADLATALQADTSTAAHRSALATAKVQQCVAEFASEKAEWRLKMAKADPWLLAATDWARCLQTQH